MSLILPRRRFLAGLAAAFAAPAIVRAESLMPVKALKLDATSSYVANGTYHLFVVEHGSGSWGVFGTQNPRASNLPADYRLVRRMGMMRARSDVGAVCRTNCTPSEPHAIDAEWSPRLPHDRSSRTKATTAASR